MIMIHHLPSDCRTNIISYLPLRDVINYASSSQTSLQNTLSDINNRREKLTRTILWDERRNKIITRTSATSSKDLEQQQNYHNNEFVHDNGVVENNTSSIIELPSILDRIESLYQNLSSSHSMHESVYELVTILKKCKNRNHRSKHGSIYTSNIINHRKLSKDDSGNDDDNYNDDNEFDVDFKTVLQSFQQLLKVFKIHTIILKSAIYGKSVHNDYHKWHQIHGNGNNTIDLHLDQYLGDVHIAFLFMGNISSGLIEGVSEDKWLQSIQTDIVNDNNSSSLEEEEEMHSNHQHHQQQYDNTQNSFSTETARTSYKNWIFLHSSLLRTIQLSENERSEFGLFMNGNIMKRTSTNNNHDHDDSKLIFPPRPFQGLFKTNTILKLYNSLLHHDGLLRVLFRDFGSLGPSFRMRLVLTVDSAYDTGCICFYEEYTILSYTCASGGKTFIVSRRISIQ